MNAIKNVGRGAVEEILRAREVGPGFSSIEDFLGKVSPRIVNKKAMDSLIKAGAFDRFGDRSTLLHNIESMLAHSARVQKDLNSGQTDLFGNLTDDVQLAPKLIFDESQPKFTSREQLGWERELLGLYLSSHPLNDYEVFLAEQVLPIREIEPGLDGKTVKIGGSVSESREITTKNGQKMAFVKIVDMFNEIELILFPNSYQQTLGIWERDNVVIVSGKVSAKDRDGNIGTEVKVMVDDAREVTLEQAQAYQATGKTKKKPKVNPKKNKKPITETKINETSTAKRLFIRLFDSSDTDRLEELKSLLDREPGHTEVVLVMGVEDSKKLVKLPMQTKISDDLIASLRDLFGKEEVRLH